MITLKNGLILSVNEKAGGTEIEGFESFNHLTSKIDPKSFTKFTELPDIFYKEINEDDRVLLTSLDHPALSTILDRTKKGNTGTYVPTRVDVC
ncbi:MAG: hypothetical protein H8D95_01075 [Candidatus Endolissoclinum sp.]|nr:hypothetical protein [Candidatus Endolissoclinum sp.]